MSTQVYVRGISKKATRESIQQHFSSAGSVKHLLWSGPENPQLKGICRVEYESHDIASYAAQTLNRSVLHGVALSVRVDLGATAYSNSRECSRKFISMPRSIRPINDDIVSSADIISASTELIVKDGAPTKRPRLSNDDNNEVGSCDHNMSCDSNSKTSKQAKFKDIQIAHDDELSVPATTPLAASFVSRVQPLAVRYTNDSVISGGICYPTPRGVYLMQLLQLCAGSTLTSVQKGISSYSIPIFIFEK